ncbi:MAG: hypothetical protein BM557_11450 [Flavobacterium sp. MedPE-SWcel]|uniref:hypothetical protein n=1 Tax=uncultured Flavobacterium sp. TaxID=165435 RepID=UPI00091DE4BD|nr:hypothetical protein [uncultured Flavobacterium sp.]OIQ15376.1 MAG: hypothetical protein BM557_11450 [Flavobacterium sp. MedPE-SWcel]
MITPEEIEVKIEFETNVFDLKSLLITRNIDVNRYESIGAGFYHQYEDCYDASIICIDRVKFLKREPYIIKIILEDFTNEEYTLFREKFETVMAPNNRRYYDLNIDTVILQSEINKLINT